MAIVWFLCGCVLTVIAILVVIALFDIMEDL